MKPDGYFPTSVRYLMAALLVGAATARAQLQWTAFDETATTPVATSADGRVTITIAGGQRATLIATNFLPIDFTAPTAATSAVTVTFKATGGLSGISSGTRAIGFGLFNTNGTTPGTTFIDDTGYFTWLNGRSTGSLIELRRRNGNGPSPSLLNPTGASFNTLGTGTTVQTVGALSDAATYSLTLRLVRSANGVSLGTTSANTANAGVVILGDDISQTAYTNPDNPPAATVFNEVGFMFFNSTASPIVLTIESVTGLTPINPPSVASQPQSLILNPGQPATLNITASGTPPLTYQWRKDGTAITGATSSAYTIANTQAGDAGSYTVVVTNAYGNVTSPAATLTVTTETVPATIATQPAPVTVTAGQAATFSVAAFGSSPVNYQWRRNGTAIAGATTNTLTLANVTPADAGDYTVVVSNSTRSVTSSPATLTVNTSPTITTQPASVTINTGQRASFTVAATGNPTPTFQWQKNGVNIAGATDATLTIATATLADTGIYTARVVNSIGAVSTAPAVLAIPSTMRATSLAPANAANGINIDTPLRITFDRAPVVGATGRIRIYRASDNTLVDTLDLGASPQTRTIGTQTTPYIFYPIIVTGNTAAIYPHAGVLAYGQTYYVTIEQSALLDATGASFTGISDTNAWRFTTKATGPAANATAITVAADGTGDFSTVQGAIDFVPSNNQQRVVITVKRGLYNEINYIGSTKPFITVRGEDRAQTIIAYPNNNNFNTLAGNNRAMFACDANDFTLETITLQNTTPAGGSQAEALRGNGQRCIVNRVNLISLQDTLLWNGRLFVTDSYIEGDVDFMWGNGTSYFQRCELKAVRPGFYTQIRNGQTNPGNVYVECRLTGVEGLTNVYLGRIDPNPGNFPYSQSVFINCAMGPHIVPEGWRLDNATSAPNVQFWEYQSTDLTGATLDVSRRLRDSRQLTDVEAARWRDPSFVLGGWSPQIAPTFETPPPLSATVIAGANARLSVVANGAPIPTLQWFKDGAPLVGATDQMLVLANVQPSSAGRYTVMASNSEGSVTSAAGVLTVTRAPHAGTYFGTLGGSAAGTFALYLRDNGTGVFLAQSGSTVLTSRNVTLLPNGRIQFAPQAPGAVTPQVIAEGTVDAAAGTVNGMWGGVTFSGSRSANGPATEPLAGYYPLGANGSGTTGLLMIGGNGQAFILVQNGATYDIGVGTISPSGNVSLRTTADTNVTGTVASNGASAVLTLTPASGPPISVTGLSESRLDVQRLRQFSTRGQAAVGSPIIAGFVVTGDASTALLIRAIGPSLGDLFGVAGALSNPRLELYRGTTLLASNTGWTTANNAGEIAAAAAQSGAFPLRANVADSAIRITLAPGAYTALLSGATGGSGAGLVEVYDLSAGAAGQRLVNLSTRALAGTGSNTVIAGVFVGGTEPKRMLFRGVGPTLTSLGVSGALARPALAVYRGTTLVAQNTGWSTSADAVAIAAAAFDAGAFPLAPNSADAALLLHLAPGLYTAQVSSTDNTTGQTLIEIYEVR